MPVAEDGNYLDGSGLLILDIKPSGGDIEVQIPAYAIHTRYGAVNSSDSNLLKISHKPIEIGSLRDLCWSNDPNSILGLDYTNSVLWDINPMTQTVQLFVCPAVVEIQATMKWMLSMH